MIIQLIKNALICCLIIAPFYALFRFLFLKFKKKTTTLKREILMFVFAEYMVVLLSQALDPRRFFNPLAIKHNLFYRTLQLVPLKTINQYLTQGFDEATFINIVANTLILVPFGVLVPILWDKSRSFGTVFWKGTLLILGIEFTQYFIGRAADIDDYILNILGVCLGYWGLTAFAKKTMNTPAHRERGRCC